MISPDLPELYQKMGLFPMLFYANIDLSRFSLVIKTKHLNYSIPFDREFHELQNGIENIENTLSDLTKPASGHDLFDSLYN
jgi:hypothetical protein